MTSGQLSPLLNANWTYVEKIELEAFRATDWNLLKAQRSLYLAEQQGTQVLRLLTASRDDPTFGYQVNNYRHSVQSATLALSDGRPEEYVVAALLHDIGFVACPTNHGAFSARLMAPYIDDNLVWMLEHHMYFQTIHCREHPDVDRHLREKWRGHPCFAMTAEFVAKYDQNAIDPAGPEAPIDIFIPMVQRIFARSPRALPLPA